MTTENTHHEFSPSSLDAMSECPLYRSSPGESSDAANAGTAQHEALAKALAGKPEWPDGLSSDAVEAVQFALDWLKVYTSLDVVQTEVRLEILNDDFEVITHGTTDIFIPEPLTIMDYKSGEARAHYFQLMAYALGAMQKTGKDTCRVMIIYGRLKRVDDYVVHEDEARNAIETLFASIKNPDAAPKPCEFCGWCAHRQTCPAIHQRGVALVQGRSDWVDVSDWLPSTWHPSEITDPVDMKKLLEVHSALKSRFDEWSDSVLYHAKEMMRKGVEIEGFDLAERKLRQVRDLMGVFQASGLTPDQFIACCTLALGKLEDAYAAANPVMAKAAAKKELNAKINPYMDEPKVSQFVQKSRKKSA